MPRGAVARAGRTLSTVVVPRLRAVVVGPRAKVVVEWLSNNALNPVRTPASRRLLKTRKRLAAGRARVSAHVVQTRNGTNKESSASVWQLFDQGW